LEGKVAIVTLPRMQLTLDRKTLDQEAIDLIQQYEPPEGYYLGFSGGKDSVVIYDLTLRSGVRFDSHYTVAPIDPPEIREFIKASYPNVAWDYYARGFWRRFLTEGPPMRTARWCCELIKEAGGTGRLKLLGMRQAESAARKHYSMLMPNKKMPNTSWFLPIVSWSNSDVWQYIRENHLATCSLYSEGYERLGCILCPFESPVVTQRNIQRFPKIAQCWRRAFDRYFDKRIDRGTPLPYATKEEFWQWWIRRS